jgi:hypothetical protein
VAAFISFCRFVNQLVRPSRASGLRDAARLLEVRVIIRRRRRLRRGILLAPDAFRRATGVRATLMVAETSRGDTDAPYSEL